MYKKLLNHHSVWFLGVLILLGSCHQAILEDITEARVTLVAPSNGVQIEDQTITFLWNEVEGASSYRLQIGKPSFDSLATVVLDSTVEANSYTYTLNPGNYEWRVQAKNSGYESGYTTYRIRVDSSENLSGAQVVLSSPVDSFFTASLYPQFSWEPIALSSFYGFRIVRGSDFENGELFTSKVETTNNSLTLTKALENGKFTWGVNAENAKSKTGYSKRFIWFDNISPVAATPNNPQDNATQPDGNVVFTWTRPSDSGTPLYDSLFLYSDPGLTTLIKKVSGAGQTYSDSLTAGDYYWRIRATDRAGNVGTFSVSRKVTIP
ncbi:hypothetical protein KFE98_19135 [bacterium SCSIO 12741]|nr:hypothetical protein KFE98_19135 [bacterium SCSIO 12741]